MPSNDQVADYPKQPPHIAALLVMWAVVIAGVAGFALLVYSLVV
jgi:hypothetical protein